MVTSALRRGLAKGDETTDLMYHVYILKSKTRKWYHIGHTSNLDRRLKIHNLGKNKSTKPYRPYRPFDLAYNENYKTKSDAFKREQQIKKYRHGEAFKKLVA